MKHSDGKVAWLYNERQRLQLIFYFQIVSKGQDTGSKVFEVV